MLDIRLVNGKYATGRLSSKDTLELPIVDISMEYDEVIVDFSKLDRMEDNFRFRITPKGKFCIGKYMVELDRAKSRVILNRIGMTSEGTEYLVSPYRQDDNSYFQAGAVYFDDSKDMGYTAPIYKIEAEETLKAGWVHKVQLGNSHLNIQTVAAAVATHPECYVFCAGNGISESVLYNFSEGQVARKSKITIGKKEYEVTGKQSASGFNPANGGNMKDIVYTLSGINSEVLDQEQGTGIEAILAKLGIAIGDLFLSAFRGCVRTSKY